MSIPGILGLALAYCALLYLVYVRAFEIGRREGFEKAKQARATRWRGRNFQYDATSPESWKITIYGRGIELGGEIRSFKVEHGVVSILTKTCVVTRCSLRPDEWVSFEKKQEHERRLEPTDMCGEITVGAEMVRFTVADKDPTVIEGTFCGVTDFGAPLYIVCGPDVPVTTSCSVAPLQASTQL